MLKSVWNSAGVSAEIISTPQPDNVHLIARIKGTTSAAPVLLLAHSDVVPVERDKWEVDPFGGGQAGSGLGTRGTTAPAGWPSGTGTISMPAWCSPKADGSGSARQADAHVDHRYSVGQGLLQPRPHRERPRDALVQVEPGRCDRQAVPRGRRARWVAGADPSHAGHPRYFHALRQAKHRSPSRTRDPDDAARPLAAPSRARGQGRGGALVVPVAAQARCCGRPLPS